MSTAERTPRDRREAHRRQGLFPCEAEIARRLSQELGERSAKAIVLERRALPQVVSRSSTRCTVEIPPGGEGSRP